MSARATSFSVGWDVGAWRTTKGDALWILDASGQTLGRWHGNLLKQIREATDAAGFMCGLFRCCNAVPPPPDQRITLAIDAPLTFPPGVATLLKEETMAAPERETCACIENPYLFRRTEAFAASHRRPKRNPLSPIQDQIGSQVTKVLHVLNKYGLKHDGKGVWRTTGSPVSVIEAYPAMSKTGREAGLLEPVKSIFDAQTAAHAPDTDDERDALICAIIAHLHTHAPETLYPPEGDYFTPAEGWIWFPKR